jgi:glycosyltransferase involved in cell wall biosynthesis
MRILYICGDQGIPVFGRKGASTHIREMIAEFRRQGHEVALAAPDLSGDRRADEDFQTFALPAPKSRKLGLDGRYMLANWRARGVLARHAAGFRPDAIYERNALYFDAGERLARRLGVPRIMEINAILAIELAHRLHYPKLALKRETRVIANAPAVTAVSVTLMRDLVAHGVPRDRIRKFSTAVDPRIFRPEAADERKRAALGWPDDAIVLGWVGSMNSYHQPGWFMELADKLLAEGRHPRLRFLVVGGADDRIARYREQVAPWIERGLVHFVGRVPQREMPGWIAATSAVLVPGADAPQTPTKIFEAGAIGRPLILPATEPIRDLLGADNPLLFPAGDQRAFEALVRRYLDDPAAFDEPTRRLRELVLAENTWEHHARELVQWFREMGARG